MADDEGNKPVEHEAQPEAAEHGTTVPTPEQHKDEPKVESDDSKSEWRRTVLTAGISALAALIGAGVGGLASYQAAKSQGDTQIKVAQSSVSVAQSSASAEAEATLMAKRRDNYANYLTIQIDLQGVESTLSDYFLGRISIAAYYDDFQKTVDQYNDLYPKSVNADFIVALSDSPEVDQARQAIAFQQNNIANDIATLAKNARENQPLDSKALQDIGPRVDGLQALYENFSDIARTADMHLPPRNSTLRNH